MLKILQCLLDGVVSETGVRIQVRRRGDTIWRDHCFAASNPESVQSALQATVGLFPDTDVRAVDRYGRMVDYR